MHQCTLNINDLCSEWEALASLVKDVHMIPLQYASMMTPLDHVKKRFLDVFLQKFTLNLQ